jgi:hypothetical protein
MRILKSAFATIAFALLAACGGGSSDTPPVVSNPWVGTKMMGAAGTITYGNSVATDLNGNVYVTGWTQGGLDGNTLTGTGDFYLIKYDRSGVKQYTKQMGVAGVETYGNSVATDGSGNVYVVGYTDGGLDGNSLTGTRDLFLIKYDSSGVKQYSKQMGVAGAGTTGYAVATDLNGNVYVTGWTEGGLDGNTLTGTVDFFLTKYNSSGVKQYTKQMGVAGVETYGNSVATDGSGNVYVVGVTYGGLDGNTLTGERDTFLIKFDSSGVKQYTQQTGVVGALLVASSVAIDPSGNVYVSGDTSGGLDGNPLTGTYDILLTKYDSSGIKQYSKLMGAAGVESFGNSVATDRSGNVYVSGWTEGGLDGNTLAGIRDLFLVKYDPSGVKQYTKQMGVAGANTYGFAVTTDATGNVYVVGDSSGLFDGNTLTAATYLFVTKFDDKGVKQ